MRTVDAHLLEEKMDEVVTHYINSHPHSESVNVDTSSLGLNIQEENGHRIVTLMHPQGFSSQSSQMCRAEDGGEGWSEELLDPEVRIAALAAHLAQQSRVMHHQMSTQHKAVTREVESSVILDRLGFNGQALDHQTEPIVVEVPTLPSLPPLQGIKRCQDSDWFKTKTDLKDDGQILSESDLSTASPAAKQQSKKSLPHKKRISRKLKRNTGGGVCADDLVVLNCSEAVQHEEILPDSYVTSHTGHMTDEHHIGHEVRPVFICQLCSAFFGGDQLKFYQHLKQHYEPHATIIIENPVSDLGIDKMTNTCIVDNVATLPDSIVELSLESTMHKTIYPHQAIDRHILYTTSDKLQYSNKVQYSMASIDKEVHTTEVEKQDLYESLEKVELYSCTRCHRNFRKQKQCEAHIRDVHSKLEELNEFSEPEDLMEGIHVSVSVSGEEPEYAPPLLPPLQDHHSYRYSSRLGGSGGHTLSDEPCDLYHSRESHHEPHQLKEEVFQRIFDGDIDNPNFSSGIIHEETDIPPEAENPEVPEAEEPKEEKAAEPAESKKDLKKFSCGACPRVFNHRNSLLYHSLSHKGKRPHQCTHCGKGFYTKGALKVHIRVHNGDKPYKCDECGRDFRQWGDLKYHIISIHTEKKHFKCEFCGKEFSRKYSLNVHRRIHTGEKNYKCEYCVKTFRTSSYRLTHMRTHTGYKPHKCEQCDKCFRVCADLRRHMLTHERVRNRLQEVNKDKKDSKETKKNNPKSDAKPDQERKDEIIVKNHAKETKNVAKPLILKSESERKPKAKKAKKGAPNVTVSKSERAPEVNDYPSNVEVYDSRYNKFKEVFNFESGTEYKGKESYTEPSQPRTEARDFATLRPMMRTSLDDSDNKTVFLSKHENTDGKLTVFTHVEKPKNYSVPIVANTQVNMGDMRPNLELREGRELQSDSIENGFFERFNESAFYNIPAV